MRKIYNTDGTFSIENLVLESGGGGGGSFNTGTAILDFSATPSTESSIAVIGQASILSTSLVEAWVMGSTTVGNNENAHLFAGVGMRLTVGIPTAGVGFTIYGTTIAGMCNGTFNIQWGWS